MVRRVSVVLDVIGLLCLVSGCGDGGDQASPSGGEVPGGLPWGGRTLTGTVERDGDCLMLLVGARRWALTGDAARGLTAGQRVTVHGSLAIRPAACADRELVQTVAVTRVAPA